MRSHVNVTFISGLAIVFAEDPADTDAANSPRPGLSSPFGQLCSLIHNILAAWDQLCPTWDALPESVKNAGSRVF